MHTSSYAFLNISAGVFIILHYFVYDLNLVLHKIIELLIEDKVETLMTADTC